jgi:hypothetical protein
LVDKLVPEHKDKFNQVLSLGEYVIAPVGTKRLEVCTIVKITKKMIRLNPVGHERNQWGFGEFLKYPGDCIKLESPALTMYVLAKSG